MFEINIISFSFVENISKYFNIELKDTYNSNRTCDNRVYLLIQRRIIKRRDKNLTFNQKQENQESTVTTKPERIYLDSTSAFASFKCLPSSRSFP